MLVGAFATKKSTIDAVRFFPPAVFTFAFNNETWDTRKKTRTCNEQFLSAEGVPRKEDYDVVSDCSLIDKIMLGYLFGLVVAPLQ